METKSIKRSRRHLRIKKRFNPATLRLVVFRSLNHIYGQVVDDTTRKTLVSASDVVGNSKGTKTERAMSVGKELGKKAIEAGISICVFDRAGYKYHGRVKALCEGAREAGLKL